jgi:UDP-N-acetylmuramate dehydrogenase
LNPNAPPTLKYADLKNYFTDAAEPPRLIDVYNAVREIRSRKGMVVRPDDPDSRSAGSFFKNPTVTMAESERIMAQAGGDIPHWPQENGAVKLSAAWLIERAGFRRGEAFGNVGLSSKHVLALINRGSGTAAELTALARRIQDGVIQTWGVTLSPEPVFLGFGSENTLPLHAVRAG